MVDKLKLFKEIAKTAVGELVNDFQIDKSKFICGIPECNQYGIGIVCEKCSRQICMSHSYCKLELSNVSSVIKSQELNKKKLRTLVKFICPSCIADNHAEIFEPI